jgi:hypothetical protein
LEVTVAEYRNGNEKENSLRKITGLNKATDVTLKRGVNLISDALPFGGLWCGEPNAMANAIGYAQFYSRSHDAVIRVYDDAGNTQSGLMEIR